MFASTLRLIQLTNYLFEVSEIRKRLNLASVLTFSMILLDRAKIKGFQLR